MVSSMWARYPRSASNSVAGWTWRSTNCCSTRPPIRSTASLAPVGSATTRAAHRACGTTGHRVVNAVRPWAILPGLLGSFFVYAGIMGYQRV
ncbi:protein of unknown function [Burkholderia multivorans]